MKTYIAFLRGVNVRGENIIKMVDLQSVLLAMGFQKVVTYIQSGNIAFKSKESSIDKLRIDIENALENHFNLRITAVVKTKAELQEIIENNPFPEEHADVLYVTLLSEMPKVPFVADKRNDDLRMVRQEIYQLCPMGYYKTKFTNNYFERTFSTPATTRNWQTICQMRDIVEEY